jgi:2-dehydropantoate 2-reductase
MTVAVLGPGGVGGLLAGVLDRAGTDVVVVARESTATVIAQDGLRIQSVTFGDFVAHPRALA